ncbi:E3 ubiquitin-protein ligase TRIM65 [Procambarus clarkii]|uniref:E3 ubiquitin-protein ligase TRIM65 n=1 Tax=Procambarus clarkii TaxID=6728 RepID=UPI001E676029|nr:tripartite motif-containing protein 65-like [Procambarus clarkii]XP_045587033.1 tripartite motif-containing protein 65-like [Procambarus clarkii]XP_045587035.1 tripartite motif-containing protein 65-like [Procambarus clarkii]
MDEDNPLECKVCFTEYDDDLRRPRNLPCGHTFCTSCIADTIANGRLACPNCRKEHYAHCSTEFPISYLAEVLIKSLRAVRISVTTAKRPRRDSPKVISKKLELLKCGQENIVRTCITKCQQARTELDNYEEQIIKWKVDHDDLMVKIDRVAKQNKEALSSLEEEHRHLIEVRQGGIEEERRLEAVLDCLTQAVSAQEVDTAIDDAEVCSVTAMDWTNTCQNSFPDVKALHTSLTVRETTRRALEVMASEPRGAVAIPALRADSTTTIQDKIYQITGNTSQTLNTSQAMSLQEKITEYTVEYLRSCLGTQKKSLTEGRMFAMAEGEPVRSAKISLSGDRICLHYLQDKPVTKGVKTFKHNHLMSVLDAASTLVFLDLMWENTLGAWDSAPGGRVYIRLSNTTTNPWAQQFLALCTGQHGPTYANTCFIGVFRHAHEEGVLAGDYEHNDGNGGAALQQGLMSAQCSGKWTEGTVTGRKESHQTAAQFYIITRIHTAGVKQAVLGQVESGLGVVRQAVCMREIRQVKIVDCGVVLPL